MTPDELAENWWITAEKQLQRAGFVGAPVQKLQSENSFVVQLIAPRDGVFAPWIQRIATLLRQSGLDVSVQHEVTVRTLMELRRETPDVLLVWSITADLQTLCTTFAAERSTKGLLLVCVPEGDDGSLYCRLLREQHHVETISIPLGKLQNGEECGFGLDVLRQCINPLFDKAAARNRESRLRNTYILLVHGIRTRGLWQGPVQTSFQKNGVIAWPSNYEKFDTVRFLLPFDRLKQTAIERVRKELEAIRSISPTAEVCVVAHSFGSYIIGNLLHSGEQFKAIAFTGSVLPSKFDFSAAGGTPIVNEVACSDVWPVLAQKIGWGYGATGTFGFNRGSVIDRVHHGFGHSNALTSEFCTRFWVPFFCSNRVEPSDFDHVRNSLSVRILDRIPIWLLAIGVIVACSCGLLFRIVSVLMSHFL